MERPSSSLKIVLIKINLQLVGRIEFCKAFGYIKEMIYKTIKQANCREKV